MEATFCASYLENIKISRKQVSFIMAEKGWKPKEKMKTCKKNKEEIMNINYVENDQGTNKSLEGILGNEILGVRRANCLVTLTLIEIRLPNLRAMLL